MDYPNLELEKEAMSNFAEVVAGVDEVGRGSLAGPVVAAAVHIPEGFDYTGIKDSKKLSGKKRKELFGVIARDCIFSIAEVDEKVIDKINIKEATMIAMKKAIADIPNVDFALIDGNALPKLRIPAKAVIKGDNISVSIAAASIMAKVYRDAIMEALHFEYPIYGWNKNMGYGTLEHRNAIKKHGVSEYHRKTFKCVKEYC